MNESFIKTIVLRWRMIFPPIPMCIEHASYGMEMWSRHKELLFCCCVKYSQLINFCHKRVYLTLTIRFSHINYDRISINYEHTTSGTHINMHCRSFFFISWKSIKFYTNLTLEKKNEYKICNMIRDLPLDLTHMYTQITEPQNNRWCAHSQINW